MHVLKSTALPQRHHLCSSDLDGTGKNKRLFWWAENESVARREWKWPYNMHLFILWHASLPRWHASLHRRCPRIPPGACLVTGAVSLYTLTDKEPPLSPDSRRCGWIIYGGIPTHWLQKNGAHTHTHTFVPLYLWGPQTLKPNHWAPDPKLYPQSNLFFPNQGKYVLFQTEGPLNSFYNNNNSNSIFSFFMVKSSFGDQWELIS